MLRKTAMTLAAIGLLSGPVGSTAQEPARRFEGRLEVTEVLLDVLVTDRRGRVVTGLQQDDFLVEENGRPVELTGVSFYSTRYGAGKGVSSGREAIPASRYFILFFHDQRLASTSDHRLVQQQLKAARQSRLWLEESIEASDWVAVTSYDLKLKVHQDFTQDREALQRAVDAAAIGVEPEPVERSKRRSISPTLPSLLRHLPEGQELRRQTARIYDGVRLLAEATGHIVGRKNLLLFSIGFGELDGIGGTAIPDRRFYPALEAALNDNNVAVYPIDLTLSGVRHAQSHFLNTLAADTGGVYRRNFVSFLTPLREIGADTTGYYLLSYRAEHPRGESGFQEVRVRTRERKLVVRARKGYLYGRPPGPKAQ